MGNIIHPTAIVGPHVQLGQNNYIGPYCVLYGCVELGDDNILTSHVSIGQPPQHRAFESKRCRGDQIIGKISIGSRNHFREFVSIHAPYSAPFTKIGSDCYLMATSHIAHDVIVEDGVTIANSVNIGGHSILMKKCNLGFSSVVHQFSVIGPFAMLGMGSVLEKNLRPFIKATGMPPRRLGINQVALERHGLNESEIAMVQTWLDSSDDAKLPSNHPLYSDLERYQQYLKSSH